MASEEAVAVYRTLSAARPDVFGKFFAGTLRNLGVVLLQLGRETEPRAAFDEHREAKLNLADLHDAQGETATAILLVEQGVELDEMLGHSDLEHDREILERLREKLE